MEKILNNALSEAWSKINDYCKKYAGISTRDVQIRWKHDVYGWIEFGVTPQGKAYINRGDHSKSPGENNTTYIGHPMRKEADQWTKYPSIEEVVKDWPAIKEILEKRFDDEKRIFNFEP